MKKLSLFIIVCLLISFFSGFSFWVGSTCASWSKSEAQSKPQLQPKPEPQPEKLKSNTHTRSPSVACSANGKIVYWISNDPGNHSRIVMYKSTDGGENWIEINNPYPPDPDSEWPEYNFDQVNDTVDGGKRKPVPIPRNGK